MRFLIVPVLALALILQGGGAAAQFSVFGLRNSLVQFALDRLSVPGSFEIEAGEVARDEDGFTELRDVTISDAEGVWFQAEALILSWNASRVLRGELVINRLGARGVDILRQPNQESLPEAEAAVEEEVEEPPAEQGPFGFQWPRAPITTIVDELVLDDVEIAPGVIAPQGIAFDATGSARDVGEVQAAELTIQRNDALEGRIFLEYLRDFEAQELTLDLEATEEAGGLVASILGLPEESASSVDIYGEGPLDEWRLAFRAEAERLLDVQGQAEIVLTAPIGVALTATVEPGPALEPDVAAAISPYARVIVQASENEQGVVVIDEAAIESQDLNLVAEGSYTRATGALDADVNLLAEAGLSALIDGVAFDRIAFDGTVDGSLDDLTAQGELALDDLATAAADVGRARLDATITRAGERIGFGVQGQAGGLRLDQLQPETVGDAELVAVGAYDGETLTLERFALDSPLLAAQAEGTVGVAPGPEGQEAASELTYEVRAPELAPIAEAYDVQASGSAAVEGVVSGPLSAPRIVGEAALRDVTYDGESYGRVALNHDVTLGETPEGEVALTASGSPYGPAEVSTEFRLADQTLTLSEFAAQAVGAALEGQLAVDLETNLADGRVEFRIADLATLEEQAGVALEGDAQGVVTLTAEDGEQTVDVEATGENVRGFDVAIESFGIDATVRQALTAPVGRGEITLQALEGPEFALGSARFEGEAELVDETLVAEGVLTASDIEAAEATIASMRVEGEGTDLLDTPEAQVEVLVEGVAYPPAEARVAEIRFDGTAQDLTGEPSAQGELVVSGVEAAGASVESVTASLEGETLIESPSARLDLTARGLAYPEADARVAEVTFEGSARDLLGSPEAQGVLTAESIEAAGATIGSLTLRGEGESLIESPSADVALTVEDVAYPEADARVASITFEGSASELLTSPDAQGTLAARGITAAGGRVGDLEAEFQGTDLIEAPEGTLEASLGAVSAAGYDVSGVRLEAAARQAEGGLVVEADVSTGAIRGEGVAIAGVDLDATVEDALSETPRVRADAVARSVQAGGVDVATLTAVANGPLDALDLAVDATGETEEGEPLDVTLRAQADVTGEEVAATVTRLDARAGELDAALTRPARISVGDVTRVQDLRLSALGGLVEGDVALHPNGLVGDVVVDLPRLEPVAELADLPVESGALNLTAEFDTRPGSARADLDIVARDLVPEALEDVPGGVDATVTADWNGARLEAGATVSGPFERPLLAEFALPLRPTSGLIPAPPTPAPIEGSLNWQGRLGDLWALVPVPDLILDGEARVALAFDGTLEQPEILGDVALRDGTVQYLTTGTILTGFTINSNLSEGGAFRIQARATDGAGGPVTAEVVIADGALDAEVVADEAVLVRRDDVTASITGQVDIVGPLTAPAISGDLVIDRAEVRLVDATPPSVATLGDVRFVGEEAEEEDEGAEGVIPLDIEVRGEQIFVRGRGLDSQWRLALDVSGTASQPILVGQVEAVRGRLSLIGFPFELTRGEIAFDGGAEIDPRLDVALFRENDGVTGGIVVSGFASEPELGFESTPVLPEEEVLPRVLFGTSTQSLSSGQAIQLAAGIATLLGGGGGPVDAIRAATGLDVLRFGQEGGEAGVTVGRNLTDDIFVGARQPIEGGSPTVSVEVEVIENVVVDTEIGVEAGSSVGLSWKKDF